MTKRELIDRKQAVEVVSNGFDRQHMINLLASQGSVPAIPEREIVKPYLEKLKADIEAAYDELDGYDPDALGTFASRIDDLIDNLLSESEGKE